MAISINDGFSVGSSVPVDSRLTLSKSEMQNISDAIMPEVYLCMCSDDGLLYTYNKTNEVNETGKFRVNSADLNMEAYTDEEVGAFFDFSPEEVEEMTAFISDNEVSKFKVWSSDKTKKAIDEAIAESANLIDDEADNTVEDKTWSAKKISDELGENITWKLFGQVSGETPVTISKCNELMVTFYFESAGIIVNIPILYEDVTQTVRHFCNSFNRNSSLQLDVDISATTSQVAISSAMWGGSDVSNQCGITVRYR